MSGNLPPGFTEGMWPDGWKREELRHCRQCKSIVRYLKNTEHNQKKIEDSLR